MTAPLAFEIVGVLTLVSGVVAWIHGKRQYQRWLSIHPWHSTHSYGHVRTVRPPYDWERDLHD